VPGDVAASATDDHPRRRRFSSVSRHK
jgi:hypothetical protein